MASMFIVNLLFYSVVELKFRTRYQYVITLLKDYSFMTEFRYVTQALTEEETVKGDNICCSDVFSPSITTFDCTEPHSVMKFLLGSHQVNMPTR